MLARQEYFEDVRALFGSLAFRGDDSEGRINHVGAGRGDNVKARVAREVNLRTLLDQLQIMKAEPRNHLRCKPLLEVLEFCLPSSVVVKLQAIPVSPLAGEWCVPHDARENEEGGRGSS